MYYLASMQSTKRLTNKFILKKYFSISVLGALLGISIYFFILYSELQETAYQIKDTFLAGTCGVLIAIMIFFATTILNNFLPWKTHTGNRLLAGLTVHFLISYFLVLVGFYSYRFLFFNVDDFFKKYYAIIIKLGIILLILTLIFELIYFALYSYYSFSKFQIETVKQERKQIELQLKALKSQLSPHFLFNSLNTISSLIYKDENRTAIFIRRLAKMYDFTLKSYHQKLITVKEELEFVDAYNYLLQTRFEHKFTCKVSISDDLLSTKIPPLTLQILVENAIKHNQLSIGKPLEIHISSTETSIIIENNITETPKNITSFKIGLKNINKRYLLLVHKSISIIKANNFTVKIPIIR
jgi:two-component system LytT family sensor kinase